MGLFMRLSMGFYGLFMELFIGLFIGLFMGLFMGLHHHAIHLQVGPYSSHGHSSSSNMYTPIQPLNGINGAKSTCGSNGQHSVASLQMV